MAESVALGTLVREEGSASLTLPEMHPWVPTVLKHPYISSSPHQLLLLFLRNPEA